MRMPCGDSYVRHCQMSLDRGYVSRGKWIFSDSNRTGVREPGTSSNYRARRGPRGSIVHGHADGPNLLVYRPGSWEVNRVNAAPPKRVSPATEACLPLR